MTILIVSQRFWPENFRITDIAENITLCGNKVTILTGLPNYPKGYIFDDYKNGKNRTEEHNGVHVVRAKEIERRHDIIHRFLNYYSFPFFANKLIKKLDNDFDVVLINELSPIMCAYPGLKYAKKHNKKVVMYEMDLWPESLLAGGVTKKSLLYKYYKRVSSRIYSKCDKILVSTKEHIDYIRALPKCENLDIEYLPQYAESFFESNNSINTNKDTIDLMFAGNVGKAQSVETIIKAANILKEDKKYHFHIVGDGSELENVKKLTSQLELNNVTFYGNHPVSEMPSFYEKADAMLVTLEDKAYANMTIPGKVQSYMASGKPIIGAISGATQNLINDNNLGICVDSEDYVALSSIIKSLNKEKLEECAINAKEYYKNNFTKDIFMNKLIKELEKHCDKKY